MSLITIFTKERGRAPADLPRTTLALEIAFHDVTIPPLLPLQVGLSVRIQTLSRSRNRDGSLSKGYVATPTGIEGRITGVRMMELAYTEFTVVNNNPRSSIRFAHLSIKHIQGRTVCLSLWQIAIRTLLLPVLPHTRHIPLDDDADVSPRTSTGYAGFSRAILDDADEPEVSEDEAGGEA